MPPPRARSSCCSTILRRWCAPSSRALSFSEHAPPAVILGLALDQPEIASWVLEHSPLLLDTDLVDAVANGTAQTQLAIANRAELPCPVAAAIAEVGPAEACLVLLEIDAAGLPISAYPAFREALKAMREGSFDPGGATRLKRRMVERVLARCADQGGLDVSR